MEDAYKKLNSIELNQLVISGDGNARFTLYPKEQLLSFVGGTTTSVFGTCFVTYSCFNYVEFTKNYNTQGIYQFGIYEDREIGYNSLLLSPKGLSWAKNFNKIVFLSPVIDKNFISALNKITDAEIYVPIEDIGNPRKFAGIDLSRQTFGLIYKLISGKTNKEIYNVFELYDKCDLNEKVSFNTFYSALLVFNELKIIELACDKQTKIKINKQVKRDLLQSNIYNNLLLIKNTFKGENENVRKHGS